MFELLLNNKYSSITFLFLPNLGGNLVIFCTFYFFILEPKIKWGNRVIIYILRMEKRDVINIHSYFTNFYANDSKILMCLSFYLKRMHFLLNILLIRLE